MQSDIRAVVDADTRLLEQALQKAVAKPYKLNFSIDQGSSGALGRIRSQLGEFDKSLAASNARVMAFSASAGVMFGVTKSLKEMVRVTVEVERKMTSINSILGAGRSQFKQFGNDLFKIARDTSTSFEEVADAAEELARQGVGIEETLKRTSSAMKLAKVSGVEVKTAVDAITAALNSNNDAWLDSEKLINKLVAVDAKFAVSAGGLAEAIKRVGSVASDAGLDIDDLVAAITSAQQTTARGEAVIGNALKTIFTRAQRPKVLEDFESLGIATKKATGENKSLSDVLIDVAKRYDALSSAQQQSVSELVGGVYQINILKALFRDLGKETSFFSNALNTSRNATNEADRRIAELNETLDSLFKKLAVNLTQVGSGVGNNVFGPLFKNLLKSANSGLEGMNREMSGEAGQLFGKTFEAILKGIGNTLNSPILIGGFITISKFILQTAREGREAIKTLAGLNNSFHSLEVVSADAANWLRQNPKYLQDIVVASKSAEGATRALTAATAAYNREVAERAALDASVGAHASAIARAAGVVAIPGRGGIEKLQPKRAAVGLIPQVQEMAGAYAGGYTPGQVREMNVPGMGRIYYNTAENVKQFPGMAQPAIMPPQNSRAGRNYERDFSERHGFNPYAAGGLVPNFAKNKFVQNIVDTYKQSFSSADSTRFNQAELGQSYYKNTNAQLLTLSKQSGISVEKLAYGLAALSGNTNDVLARKAVSQIVENKEISGAVLPANIEKAKKIMFSSGQTEDFQAILGQGAKTQNFAQALLLSDKFSGAGKYQSKIGEPAVMDSWAIYVRNGGALKDKYNRGAVTDEQKKLLFKSSKRGYGYYNRLTSEYKEAADELGVSVSELQGRTWGWGRGQQGSKTRNQYASGLVPNFSKDIFHSSPAGNALVSLYGKTAEILGIATDEEGSGGSKKIYQEIFEKIKGKGIKTVTGSLQRQDRPPRDDSDVSAVKAMIPQVTRARFGKYSILGVGDTEVRLNAKTFDKDLAKNAALIRGQMDTGNLPFLSTYLNKGLVPNFAQTILNPFNKQILSSFSKEKELLKYVKSLGFGGKAGSSRLFVPISERAGVKIAMNPAGIAQNEVEFPILNSDYFAKQQYSDILPKGYGFDEDNFRFGFVERLAKPTAKDFRKITRKSGLDFLNDKTKLSSTEEQIKEFLANYGLSDREFMGGNNTGVDRQGKLKLLDVGYNDDVKNRFYWKNGKRDLGQFNKGLIPNFALNKRAIKHYSESIPSSGVTNDLYNDWSTYGQWDARGKDRNNPFVFRGTNFNELKTLLTKGEFKSEWQEARSKEAATFVSSNIRVAKDYADPIILALRRNITGKAGPYSDRAVRHSMGSNSTNVALRNPIKDSDIRAAFHVSRDEYGKITGMTPYSLDSLMEISGEKETFISRGLIPNFSALSDSVSRESQSVNSALIRVGSHSSLRGPGNPDGVGVYNLRDEPLGLGQGVERAKSMGLNPKTHGIPNYADGPVRKWMGRQKDAYLGDASAPDPGNRFMYAMGASMVGPMISTMAGGGKTSKIAEETTNALSLYFTLSTFLRGSKGGKLAGGAAVLSGVFGAAKQFSNSFNTLDTEIQTLKDNIQKASGGLNKYATTLEQLQGAYLNSNISAEKIGKLQNKLAESLSQLPAELRGQLIGAKSGGQVQEIIGGYTESQDAKLREKEFAVGLSTLLNEQSILRRGSLLGFQESGTKTGKEKLDAIADSLLSSISESGLKKVGGAAGLGGGNLLSVLGAAGLGGSTLTQLGRVNPGELKAIQARMASEQGSRESDVKKFQALTPQRQQEIEQSQMLEKRMKGARDVIKQAFEQIGQLANLRISIAGRRGLMGAAGIGEQIQGTASLIGETGSPAQAAMANYKAQVAANQIQAASGISNVFGGLRGGISTLFSNTDLTRLGDIPAKMRGGQRDLMGILGGSSISGIGEDSISLFKSLGKDNDVGEIKKLMADSNEKLVEIYQTLEEQNKLAEIQKNIALQRAEFERTLKVGGGLGSFMDKGAKMQQLTDIYSGRFGVQTGIFKGQGSIDLMKSFLGAGGQVGAPGFNKLLGVATESRAQDIISSQKDLNRAFKGTGLSLDVPTLADARKIAGTQIAAELKTGDSAMEKQMAQLQAALQNTLGSTMGGQINNAAQVFANVLAGSSTFLELNSTISSTQQALKNLDATLKSLQGGGGYGVRAGGNIPISAAATEKMMAKAGGYNPGYIRRAGNLIYNSAERVDYLPGVREPVISPPPGSLAGFLHKQNLNAAFGFAAMGGPSMGNIDPKAAAFWANYTSDARTGAYRNKKTGQFISHRQANELMGRKIFYMPDAPVQISPPGQQWKANRQNLAGPFNLPSRMPKGIQDAPFTGTVLPRNPNLIPFASDFPQAQNIGDVRSGDPYLMSKVRVNPFAIRPTGLPPALPHVPANFRMQTAIPSAGMTMPLVRPIGLPINPFPFKASSPLRMAPTPITGINFGNELNIGHGEYYNLGSDVKTYDSPGMSPIELEKTQRRSGGSVVSRPAIESKQELFNRFRSRGDSDKVAIKRADAIAYREGAKPAKMASKPWQPHYKAPKLVQDFMGPTLPGQAREPRLIEEFQKIKKNQGATEFWKQYRMSQGQGATAQQALEQAQKALANKGFGVPDRLYSGGMPGQAYAQRNFRADVAQLLPQTNIKQNVLAALTSERGQNFRMTGSGLPANFNARDAFVNAKDSLKTGAGWKNLAKGLGKGVGLGLALSYATGTKGIFDEQKYKGLLDSDEYKKANTDEERKKILQKSFVTGNDMMEDNEASFKLGKRRKFNVGNALSWAGRAASFVPGAGLIYDPLKNLAGMTVEAQMYKGGVLESQSEADLAEQKHFFSERKHAGRKQEKAAAKQREVARQKTSPIMQDGRFTSRSAYLETMYGDEQKGSLGEIGIATKGRGLREQIGSLRSNLNVLGKNDSRRATYEKEIRDRTVQYNTDIIAKTFGISDPKQLKALQMGVANNSGSAADLQKYIKSFGKPAAQPAAQEVKKEDKSVGNKSEINVNVNMGGNLGVKNAGVEFSEEQYVIINSIISQVAKGIEEKIKAIVQQQPAQVRSNVAASSPPTTALPDAGGPGFFM